MFYFMIQFLIELPVLRRRWNTLNTPNRNKYSLLQQSQNSHMVSPGAPWGVMAGRMLTRVVFVSLEELL